MEYFKSGGYVSGSPNLAGHTSKYRSSIALMIILAAHLFIIWLMLNEKTRQSEPVREQIFSLVRLPPEFDQAIAEEPVLNEALASEFGPMQLKHPQIQSPEIIDQPLNFLSQDLTVSEFSSENSRSYGNIFDPKMRRKILDARAMNRLRAPEKSRTRTASDGRTYIEMGDGGCMVSMAKTDSRDRATNWGFTTCGKNDSEKAMDRVMADFESRKSPGALKSNP